MRPYNTQSEAKKSLICQVSVLLILTILICVGGRILSGNRFTTTLTLDYGTEVPRKEDFRIRWDGEEIPVQQYEVFLDSKSDMTVRAIRIELRTKRAGDYNLVITDPDGNPVQTDMIQVDRFGGAFSRSSGDFTAIEAVFFAGILFYICLALIMLVFFLRLRGPLICSYEAILACGVFIFSAITVILEVPVYIRHLQSPGLYQTWELLYDIGAGGKYFVTVSFPVVIVLGILLIISNIALLRHERPRFQNGLGLLLGVALIAMELFYFFWYSSFFQGSYEEYRIRNMVENILGIVFTYMECILFSSIVCGLRAAKHVPERDRDYILILGCGFRKDGTLPPLIRGRVDKAMEFWKRQKEETGKEAVIIPSGGQGRNEPMPEAEAMYRYMVGCGFPEHLIIREDKSANTYQNMEFSRKIIESRVADPAKANVAFSTTNYHVFRSGVWAGLAGLKAEGMGSRTKWWFWPNAFVRECVGLLANRIVPEVVLLIVLIAVFAFFTWLL